MREQPDYSGGSRAALIDAVAGMKDPDLKVFDGRADGDYQELMWRSKFCFVPYGHGWGIRLRLVGPLSTALCNPVGIACLVLG